MSHDLRDSIAAAICRFNVEIDADNNFAAAISPELCNRTCDYCRLFADYICKQINGDGNDNE